MGKAAAQHTAAQTGSEPSLAIAPFPIPEFVPLPALVGVSPS